MSDQNKLLARIFPLAAAACALLASLVLGFNGIVVQSAENRILDVTAEPQADCILILGCGIRADGGPGKLLTQRLETGFALYRAGCAPYILISGNGQGSGVTQITAMYGWLLEQGVPASDIIADPDGLNTSASVLHLRTLFGMRSALIVTQQYHLPRALYLSDCVGLEACGVAAGEVPGTGYAWRVMREILARDKDCIKGKLMRVHGVADTAVMAAVSCVS